MPDMLFGILTGATIVMLLFLSGSKVRMDSMSTTVLVTGAVMLMWLKNN